MTRCFPFPLAWAVCQKESPGDPSTHIHTPTHRGVVGSLDNYRTVEDAAWQRLAVQAVDQRAMVEDVEPALRAAVGWIRGATGDVEIRSLCGPLQIARLEIQVPCLSALGRRA